MEGTGLSATAMLTPTDAGGRPDAATVTMAREEIEEALASDEPLELVLTVDRGAGTPQDVRVNWQRSDLETVLAGTDAGGIAFSFDRAELYRALETRTSRGTASARWCSSPSRLHPRRRPSRRPPRRARSWRPRQAAGGLR